MTGFRMGGAGDISGNHNFTIINPQGPVNVNAERQSVAASRRLSAARSRWLSDRFVEPETAGFHKARDALRSPGMVVVAGPAGSGRQTAARMLLADCGPEAVLVQSVLLDDEENGVSPPADSVGDGDRLLLDLTSVAPVDLPGLLDRFEAYRGAVEARAHLLVVLPVGYQDFVDGELAGRVQEVGRPPAAEVLRSHLKHAGFTLLDEHLQTDAVERFLAASSMQQIADLADRIRHQGNGDTSLGELVRTAVEALVDQSAKAAELVAGAKDGRRRVLLFVAAMLDGGSADSVHLGFERLLEVLDYPASQDHPIDEHDLAHALRDFGISVAAGGRVEFDVPGMDAAVRDHIWRHYPGLREQLSNWAVELGQCDELAPSELGPFTVRLADQLLAVDRTEDLKNMAESWTREGNPANVVLALGPALGNALQHPRHASTFRHICYWWSRQVSLSPTLAELVILLCTGVLANSAPDQAIVRLHHLTRHNDPGVARNAAHALVELADVPRLWVWILRRLCDGPHGTGLPPVDDQLFVDIVAPRVVGTKAQVGPLPLSDITPVVRRHLVRGWRALLSRPDRSRAVTVMRGWFGVSAYADTALLLTVLVEATDARPPLLGLLFGTCRSWVGSVPDDTAQDRRQRVLSGLRERIDAALGVQHLFSDVPKGFSS